MTAGQSPVPPAFVDRLAQLHAAGTPGRWKTYVGNAKNVSIVRDPWPLDTNHAVVLSTPLRGGVMAGIQEAADADLIVYLRNHAEAILALVQEAQWVADHSEHDPVVFRRLSGALEALNRG